MAIGGEKNLSAVDTQLRAKPMRRRSKHGLELANELERRQLARQRDFPDRGRILVKLSQQVAGVAQTSKEEIGEQHPRW